MLGYFLVKVVIGGAQLCAEDYIWPIGHQFEECISLIITMNITIN